MRTPRCSQLVVTVLPLGMFAYGAIAAAGMPTFVASRFAAPAGAQRVVAADLDGDTDKDLVVLSVGRTQSSLAVYLNSGSGSFSPGWSTILPPLTVRGACDLDLADLDLDGDIDILYHVPGAITEIRRNDGSASFANFVPLIVPGQHVQSTIAFIDSGIVPDLVTYSLNPTGVVTSWRGGGGNIFTVESTTPVGNNDANLRMQMGDVTNDGVLDLVRAGTFGIEYLPGQLSSPFPTWAPPTLAWFDACADVEIAHLDGDNLPDAVVTIPFSGAIEVFHGSLTSGLLGPAPFPGNLNPGALAVGDFDIDSHPDIVVASQASDLISILPGSVGAVYLDLPVTFSGIRKASDLIVVDFDGDGDLDIAGTQLGGHVFLLENQLVP